MEFFKKTVIVIAVSVLVFAPFLQIVRAQSVTATPFGGFVVLFVPPNPLCSTSHTLMYDFSTRTYYGIAVTLGTHIYPYYNLFDPGAYVLGTRSSIPNLCLLPYPIYPIIQVGTSAY